MIKKVDVDLHTVCFFLTLGLRGVWGYFRGSRMRSRSTRKYAHRNAGDLGSRLAVCACAYDPNHVTAQGKRLGPNCACVQLPGFTRSLKLCEQCRFNSCVRVFFIPWGHVNNYAQIWAFVTSISHMGQILDSDWSRQNVLRSDWLLPSVALCTTDASSAILLLICSHEVWVKEAYDWSMALYLCVCLNQPCFH